jgi:CRISPR-associated protein Csm3
MKLNSKIFISGEIVAETGLHIGGSKSSLDIGGVDLNVIKTPGGVPYIPGSSLKGKLRTMLARIHGSVGVNKRDVDTKAGEKSDENFPVICEIFGHSGEDDGKGSYKTRLVVRDADLDTTAFETEFGDAEMDFAYSDIKWENTINRKTGTAMHPRQLERVPAGTRFRFEMVYDDYNDGKTDEHLADIRMAMRMLEGDYLGGQGSRGYGKIRFENVQFEAKSVADFKGENEKKPYAKIKF